MRVAMLGGSFDPYRTAGEFFGAESSGPAPKTPVGQAALDLVKLGISTAPQIIDSLKAKGYSDSEARAGAAEIGFVEEHKNALITGAIVLALAAVVFVGMRKRRRR